MAPLRKGRAPSPTPLTTTSTVASPDATADARSTSLATDPLPTTRVNKSNLPEIKSAIDDIVKDVSDAVGKCAVQQCKKLTTSAPNAAGVYSVTLAPHSAPVTRICFGAHLFGMYWLCVQDGFPRTEAILVGSCYQLLGVPIGTMGLEALG